MKTQKYNKLNRKITIKKYINRKSKLVHKKSKLIHKKSKLIHKKSKLVHRNKKGGNPTNHSIIYLANSIKYYEDIISNPFKFNDEYKKEILQLFKHNIDNVYKCAKMLNMLYEDLDKKISLKRTYAYKRIEFFFTFMEQLKNNIMMSYSETNYFYKKTQYYLTSYTSDPKINNEYMIWDKKLIKQFINYFHNILSYQTIQYSFSNKSELKIYIENNSELTNIINQLIQEKIDGNLKYNQDNYLNNILDLYNMQRQPTKDISIIWDNNNDNNTIIEEILKLYDQIMILAEVIEFDWNERKTRKKKTKSIFTHKTYYNNAFLNSKKKSIQEHITYILDYYNVIREILKDSKIIDLILNYPIIDKIIDINDKDRKTIIDIIREKNYQGIIDIMENNNITKNNNAKLLSNYLGHTHNNNSQLSFQTPKQKKEQQKKNARIIKNLEQFKNQSNKENISRVENIQGKLQLVFPTSRNKESLI